MLACASLAPVHAQGDASKGSADAASAQASATRALFVAQCAACHGETGDGVGTTKLDRPARSFLDGGFSYGNTLDAVVRTITHGIPGSVMPSFASSISEADRRALAEYVIALGPQDAIPETKDSVLVLGDRALAVRGKLAPIVADAPTRPRGLLVGTTEGLTFEYRVDDVRLLGVRTGAFCDRRDWRNRGGDFVEPLGKLVHVLERGDPDAPYSDRARGPLLARFTGTSTRERDVHLTADLVVERTGERLATVDEHGRVFAPRAHQELVPAGYERVLAVRALAPCVLEIAIARAAKAPIVTVSREGAPPVWLVEREDGGFDACSVGGVAATACVTRNRAAVVVAELATGAEARASVRVIPRAVASITDAAAIQRVTEALGR